MKKIVSINQPYFFPNIGFIKMISLSDLHIVLDDVNMRKKSWITRNKFASDDKTYSLQVKDISQNRHINQHYLVDPSNQVQKFREHFYLMNRNDTFIELVMNMLSLDLMLNDEKINIANFNVCCLQLVLKILNVQTDIIFSSSRCVDIDLKAPDKLITLAKMTKSEVYLNLESGRELYSSGYFAGYGLELKFNTSDDIDTNNILYEVKYRSILKALSVFGPEVLKSYLNEVTLCKHKHLLQ